MSEKNFKEATSALSLSQSLVDRLGYEKKQEVPVGESKEGKNDDL